MKFMLIPKPDTCSLDLLSLDVALQLSKECEARLQFDFAMKLLQSAEEKKIDMQLVGRRVQ